MKERLTMIGVEVRIQDNEQLTMLSRKQVSEMILAFGRYYTILNIKKDAEEPTHPYGR
jgi:hypothetical protein